MHIDEAIRHRRSIRQFLPDPVSTVALREMLTLASLGPNVGNQQTWRFIIVTERLLLSKFAEFVEKQIKEMQEWPELEGQATRLNAFREKAVHFAKAPAVIFFISQRYVSPIERALINRGMKWWEAEDLLGHPDLQSVSAVMAYFSLIAEARGFGTCWLTTPLLARKDLQASLELKPGEEIVGLLSVGKPAEYPLPKPRKAIDELIEWK